MKVLITNLCLLFCMTITACTSKIRKAPSEVFVSDTYVDYHRLGTIKGNSLVVDRDIDLQGAICEMPDDYTIEFKGGILRNGILVGKNTKIVSEGIIFDYINIKGSWIVPKISTEMFADLSYENALRDVMALTAPDIKNRVEIAQGDFCVRAEKNEDICVPVNSNTELIVQGTIRLIPNAFTHYYIVKVEGSNISISGDGCIIGDKHTHKGKQGEWGMGLYIMKSENVHVSGLTIKECWGDCIYIGGVSENIVIENCYLDHGRRQGISITSANNVNIRKCNITNVNGTPPEYAIDVEPNKGDIVDNIMIEKVSARDCRGGFLVYGRAEKSQIGLVTIQDGKIDNTQELAIRVEKCRTAIIENCQISQNTTQGIIKCEDSESVVVRNNRYHYTQDLWINIKKYAKKIIGKEIVDPITISRCDNSALKNNKEY